MSRRAVALAFGSGTRAAATTYLVLTMTLGVHAFVRGGVGGDDLYPGLVFLLVTAPVSIPLLTLLPESRVNTVAFGLALIVGAPLGTVGLAALVRYAAQPAVRAWRRRPGTRGGPVPHP